jgi:hypothetical protein
MKNMATRFARLAGAGLIVAGLAMQPQAGAEPATKAVPKVGAKDKRSSERITQMARMNAWTVGIAGGLLEGAPIRLATEIARVVDDGDNSMSCRSSRAARPRT